MTGVDGLKMWSANGDLDDLRWFHADPLGSIIAASNINGTRTGPRYTYSPYGEPQGSDYDAASRFRYTGQLSLKDAPLWHYRARAYNPGLGRFMQTDPVGYEDQMNLYAYVGNDPVNAVDPSGMCWFCAGEVITNTDGTVTIRSSEILRAIVPGQIAWDEARSDWVNGDKLGAIANGGAMAGEIVLTVETLGTASAFTQTSRTATTQTANRLSPNVSRALTNGEEKSIRSLERNIRKHIAKIKEFKKNPTVRPGMEGRSAAEIAAQQRARVKHLEDEIQTFKDNIKKIEEGAKW